MLIRTTIVALAGNGFGLYAVAKLSGLVEGTIEKPALHHCKAGEYKL
jgi:hypothetical protein